MENRPDSGFILAELTRKLARGDEQAYRIFYNSYVDRLSRYLLVVTRGNEDQMREALQGTLIRLVRNIREFSDEATFWSWLTVLARSACGDDRRKRSRYRAFLDRFFSDPVTGSDSLPATMNYAGQLNGLLSSAMELLDEEDRQIVEAKYFENRSVREIAQAR